MTLALGILALVCVVGWRHAATRAGTWKASAWYADKLAGEHAQSARLLARDLAAAREEERRARWALSEARNRIAVLERER